MIQGYPDEASGFPGDTVTFHVATDAPQFRIDFYRQGSVLQSTGVSTEWLSGHPGDQHDPDQDWGEDAIRNDGLAVTGWQGYPFTIPDWSSGVYIAMFVEGDGQGNPNPAQEPPLDTTTPDARSGKALFVVKNPVPGVASQVLYKIPLFTYQMYNSTTYPGQVSPVGNSCGSGYQGYQVSMHRPGGGTGGTPWDVICFAPPNQDPFDLDSYRQTFVHWDAKMISWLEGNGFRVDYCTDMDIHRDLDLALLSPYALVLSVGHDEYYSQEMRDQLEAFVANGGNIAFLSGNTCYWKLEFPVPGKLFITRVHQWAEPTATGGPGRPEDSLTGVGFRHGGERNYPVPRNDSERLGYTVQYTTQWPFEASGLNDGDTFGKDQSIVGYECDGTPYDKAAPRPVVPLFNPADHTPAGLVILGTGDTSVWPGGNGAATMAMYTNSGTVFTGATTDWPRVVAAGEAHAAAITKNVMNRLGGNPKGLAQLRSIPGLIRCDAFFTPDDSNRHAIVAANNGDIHEIYFNPQTGIFDTILANIAGAIDVGAFYSPDDKMRHVIVAAADGGIYEIYFRPDIGINVTRIGSISQAIAVAGFYSPDDGNRHAIVAARNGDIHEIYFNPQTGIFDTILANIAGAIDVGAFYSPDDQMRHAVVGQADGTITEVYFNPRIGISQAVIGRVPGLAQLTAYYAANDNFFNRRVQVLTSGGRVHEVRFHPDFGIMRTVLFNTGGLSDLGGFFSNDDGIRHAILAAPNGDVQELFFNP